jgi:hypothetical protein
MIPTLDIRELVGHSILGTAGFSNRYPAVEIGKCAPLIRTGEDLEGLARCNFFDSNCPVEFNILNHSAIVNALKRVQTAYPSHKEKWQDPTSIIARRPSIGYVPPECLLKSTDKAAIAINHTGRIGEKISKIRLDNPDGAFWTKVASEKLLIPFTRELLSCMKIFNGDLLAPAVPIISPKLKTSPKIQGVVNRALASQWPLTSGGSFTSTGILYSFHVDPTALTDGGLIRNSLTELSQSLSGDLLFWGIHLHFIDISVVSRKASRIKAAKELVRQVSRIARQHGIFTWISDVGPIGPTLLDEGASFCSYYTGMTPRPIYLEGMNISDPNLHYGKVLGLWEYDLLDIKDIKTRGWLLEDTELMDRGVPHSLQFGKHKDFRVNFGKPRNIAVMERLNIERLKELSKKNIKPGTSHLGRSSDPNIAPWAAT